MLDSELNYPLYSPVDIICAITLYYAITMMIVWRIRRKIIRTALCCIVYDSCT